MKTANTTIRTREGSAYIRKLCKHFAHKVKTSYTDVEGRADFPYGVALMTTTEETLRFTISSETFDGIARIKYVIVTHLEKFAFREELTIEWDDDPVPPEPDWEEVGRQLRKPTGEGGRKTGVGMNHTNMGMIKRAFVLANPESGHQVLEIGPGNGAHLPGVMEQYRGISYTGVEISETMIHEASEKCRDVNNVAFLMTDGRSLPFAAQSFDRVVTVNTLYFWENPGAYAREIRKVLKPDGVFCLAFATESFMSKLPFTGQGFQLYSTESARELLIQAGFTILDAIGEDETIYSNTGEKVTRSIVFLLARP